MRKYFFIVAIVLMAEACLAQVDTQWGIKVGTGHTFIDFPEHYSPKQHFSLNQAAGLTFDLLFSKHIGLKTEAVLFLRNTHTEYYNFIPKIFFDPEAAQHEVLLIHDVTRNHQLLGRIPLLLQYRWQKFQVSAGPILEYHLKGWGKIERKGFDLSTLLPNEELTGWYGYQSRRYVLGGEFQTAYALTVLRHHALLGLSLTRNFTDYAQFNIDFKQPKNVDANIFLTFQL